MEPQIQYCTTEDGVSIGYCLQGQGSPLLVCAESFDSFSLEYYLPIQAAFWEEVSRHHTLVRWDPSGIGVSQRNATYSIEARCSEIDAVLKHAGIRKSAVWAAGISAAWVMAYAATRPRRLSRLILYGAYADVPEVFGPDFITSFAMLWRTNPAMAAQTSADMANRDLYAEGALQLARIYRESISGEYAASVVEAAAQAVSVEQLGKIATPTLVIHRRADTIFPFVGGQTIASKIKGARFLPLDGDVHYYPFGDSRAVIDGILGFLDAPPSSSPARAAQANSLRTVLFTDIVGHTEMMQRLGDTKGRDVLREHERITRETLKQHGGAEVKTMGDGFMASFGSVTSAMECAIALQRAFAAHTAGTQGRMDAPSGPSPSLPEPLHVRVGLNAGEPIEEDGDLFGATVILASRIAAKAGAGEILIPEPVRHLLSGKAFTFSDRGEYEMKGFDDAVRLYEVRWHE